MEAGESFKQLADYKYSLEDNVKQNFLEPFTHLQNKDIKEVNVRLKSNRLINYEENTHGVKCSVISHKIIFSLNEWIVYWNHLISLLFCVSVRILSQKSQFSLDGLVANLICCFT